MKTGCDETGSLFGTIGDFSDLNSVCSHIKSQLVFKHEPVCRTDMSGRTLYHECLARLTCEPYGVLSPSVFLPRLESLGLMCWFDQLVVSQTIDSLRAAPEAIYGCNVSASSALEDDRWQVVLNRLEREPSIAKRLVVEITENEPLNPISSRSFIYRIRQAGCRVAIDDFGVGHSILNRLVVGNPDIVKLDKSILSMVKRNEILWYQFRRLVALANENAQHVVIEGVEDEVDRQMAAEVGATWAQGFHFP
nr:EAL domain-containing protein [Burkholderia diffusa]